MKVLALAALLAVGALLPGSEARAQVAGQATVGVTVAEMRLVVLGWSAKHKLLDKDVYNDRGEKLGDIDDIIVSPKREVSYAIVEVGGFLGIGGKKVAIPMDQLRMQGNRIVLPGATKDVVRALPPFEYADR